MKRHHLYVLFLLCVTCMVLLETGVRYTRRMTRFRDCADLDEAQSEALALEGGNLDKQKFNKENGPGRLAANRTEEKFIRKTIGDSKWYSSGTVVSDSQIREVFGVNKNGAGGGGSIGNRQRYFSQYNPLKLMPVIDPELYNVSRILLVTYFRSGSSFLGDLLQQNWKTFYTFEPFHYMSDGMRISNERADEANYLLENLFNCEFPKIGHYVRWAIKPENRFLFKWNSFLWSVCRLRPSSCFDVEFLKEACLRASAQVIKVTRLHMRHVQKLVGKIDGNLRDQLRVVYLVRDPRGIYSSRRGLAWCNNSTCANPATLCSEMSEDIEVFEQLRAAQPGKFFLVRYEDMALAPREEALQLFHNIELPFSPSVARFLRTHTTLSKARTRDSKNPYSTKRDSKSVAFDWRRTLKGDELSAVEIACSDVIRRLGYKIITDEQLALTTSAVSGSGIGGDGKATFSKQTFLEELPKELSGRRR